MSTDLPRREALAALGTLGALGSLGLAAAALAQPSDPLRPIPTGSPKPPGGLTPELLGYDAAKGEYVLPPLPYAPEALEPHIDAQTMQIHHGRHHQAYVNGLNTALAELRKIRDGEAPPALIKHWSRELAFHGGGHINHCIFWACMAPAGKGGGGEPQGPLADQIRADFGSFEKFVAHFKAAAVQVEASGWAWLVFDLASRRLLVQQMERQQDLLVTAGVPIMGVDVWEHAYYLKYQNRRADYVNAFMNVVNWPFVADLFARLRA